jgi:Cu+-exporting ATPase
VEYFEAVPGKGVRARFGGETVLAGSPRFLTEGGAELAPLTNRIAALESAGRTVIAIARGGRPNRARDRRQQAQCPPRGS